MTDEPPRSASNAHSSGKNRAGNRHGLPRFPLCAAAAMQSGFARHASTTRRTVPARSSGWSATIYKIPAQSAIACVPRRMVRLMPSSGRSFRIVSKPAREASSRSAGYCETTVTRANISAGIAASASENRLCPSKRAVSLFSPKREAFPAAMTRQPARSAERSAIVGCSL